MERERPEQFDEVPPDTELGRLADAMLQLAAEVDIQAIVLVNKGEEGMTAFTGYEDSAEVASDLYQYLRSVVEANGGTLVLLPGVVPN